MLLKYSISILVKYSISIFVMLLKLLKYSISIFDLAKIATVTSIAININF